MTYRLTDEDALLARTVREYAERELGPLVDEAEQTGVFPRARVLPRMAELGLLSIGVPPELGGAGGTSLMLCLVAEELARVCGGFGIATMAPVLAGAAIVKMGAGGPLAAALAPLMQGAVLPAMAFTEPGAGSDLLALRSVVRKTEAGLRLSGSKTFISNGPTADIYLVAAIRHDHAALPRAERARGMGLYVVPRGAPGLSVGRTLAKLGMRSCETSELHFDDVPVAPPLGAGGARGGPPAPAATSGAGSGGDGGVQIGGAFGGMMALLDFNRVYIAAISLGIAQAAFEASVSHARSRVAFERPIGHHQATGFKVARMSTKLDAARALLQRACEALDAGERATRLVSEAKLFATESAAEITADAVQLHGGYGYVEELPIERYFRDARVGTIWEGTSEIQQHVICRELGLYDAAG